MTQVFVIVLGISLVFNVVSGLALKHAWSANAELRAVNEANVRTYEKAIHEQQATIATLETQRQMDQHMISTLGEENSDIRQKFDAQRATFDAWRGKLATRALAKPAVAERAARIGTRRWMCDIWEASGGVREACPGTSVPSATSGPRRPSSAGTSSDDSVRDGDTQSADSGG